MTRYYVYGRHEFADPLGRVGEVEGDATPSTEQVGLGDDWLELVLIPEDQTIWVQREGVFVGEQGVKV